MTIRSKRIPLSGILYGLLACSPVHAADVSSTTTPIHYVIVIFQENVSFDHYFATYPHALNPAGEPAFTAQPQTPSVNGLTGALMTHNLNKSNPFRLQRSQAVTCDQDHEYTAEQLAMDHGLMDKFVEYTSQASPACDKGFGRSLVMGYYDGNTVTALWNYAQRFAMSDNFYETLFGPSTPGVLNLVAGQTHGVVAVHSAGAIKQMVVNGSAIGDARPAFDDCVPDDAPTIRVEGKNIGHLLNDHTISWGWFQGGFEPTSRTSKGRAVCGAAQTNVAQQTVTDYIPHHEPFQYYLATANPHHLPPSSVERVGWTDQANHQYDLKDFWKAARAGHLPSVSFLKAAAVQDGHAGYSDPLDEQVFLVNTINELQKLPEWLEMAVIITYDDSDGWYDHAMPPIVSTSKTTADALTGPGECGVPATHSYPARCGYGPRLPCLVISPWARANFVDHAIADQSSILRFIEDNWNVGRIGDQSFDALAGSLDTLFDFHHARKDRLFLDPQTGRPQ